MGDKRLLKISVADKSAPKIVYGSGQVILSSVRCADQPVSSVNCFTNAVTLVLSFFLHDSLFRDYDSVAVPISELF